MTISALPTPPSRQRPSTFSAEGDAFLGALPTFATEANALAVEVNTKTVEARDSATLASQWATKTGSVVATLEYSAKEYAVGAAVESAKRHASGTTTTGSAKDWATKTGSEVVVGQGFGAKKYATDAEAAASAAYDSANTATTKAGEAAASAIAAGGSASAAESSAIEASKLNLGAKATAPTTDNQGDALRTGATYFDTSLDLWKVWDGGAWVVGISSVSGVSSFNGDVGDIVYEVPQLTTPSNISPLFGADISLTSGVFVAEKSRSIYGTPVGTKFQFSTSSDFTTIYSESDWIYSLTDTVECQASTSGFVRVFYWRVLCKTSVDSTEYLSVPSIPTSITVKFDAGTDVDGLASLVTVQTAWSPSTTYSAGQNVIVRFNDIRFVEYKSLTSGNMGNNPTSSPTHWELVYDNNLTTSGYFGEVLGNKCVVDKDEWLSSASYSIGDMVVVKNIPTPLKQSDLTAYVAKTTNTNKPPASNPSDWEQRNALPTGTSLAQTLGIGNTTPEVLINNDSGWLKFVHQGKIKYIAKKPFMHTVSWNDIAKAEAVYGNRTVRIGSRLYRVSLLSGAEADPSSWTTPSTATDNKGAGSEWNELVYRVHNIVPTDGTATNHGGKQVGSNWWNFTDADMVMTSGAGNGSYTWCKETLSFNTANRVHRGGGSLPDFNGTTSSGTYPVSGWRPCLTLISEPEADSSLYNAEASGVGPSVASLQYDPITDTGYYGEVTSAQFYTGTQISTATGVTAGTLQNDTEGWLKFYWHGQVLFIAKKTYRYSISWDSIDTANSVYGVNLGSTGKKTVTHAGSSTNYDVKLMKGATKDPSPGNSPGRQWNELLYRVCTGTETGEIGANWATLNPSTDLGINSVNGSRTLTQEAYQPSTAYRVDRGYDSLSYFDAAASSSAYPVNGWRPCLALAR